MIRYLAILAALLLGASTPPPSAPLVLAAASLQDALNEAAIAWARRGHPRPTLSFAGTATLARQARAGGGAELFVSADEAWLNVLAREGRLVPGTRAVLAGNRLVVVTRRTNSLRLTRANLAATLARGPVAMADPDAVPAGRYGRAALQRLGVWGTVAPHVVRTDNVRAALALVERGGAPYGVVYRTDALASRGIVVAGVFPARSHPPIRYPIARLAAGRPGAAAEGEGFRRFLLGPVGQAILARHGFSRP